MNTKHFLYLMFLFLVKTGFSQIKFEKGYFITNSGEKVECLIKNVDWKNNPIEFEYKLSKNSKTNFQKTKNITEFGIYNFSKYIKEKVKIDRDKSDLNNLSTEREANFKEEDLVLKVLIEGQASLYYFEAGNLKLFFYNLKEKPIKQLVQKNYLNTENEIATNNSYKQQLWNNLKCSSITIEDVKNLDYKKKVLINYFKKYNQCNNYEYKSYTNNNPKKQFNINIRPGIKSSSLIVNNTLSDNRDFDTGVEIAYRLGVELEFVLPFNKNKWALLLEPTYQSFNVEKEIAIQNVKVEYNSLELPIGFRHYIFLNNGSKLFLNSLFILDFPGNSKINYELSSELSIKSRTNFAFGIGYNINNKYSFELRHQTNRNVLSGNYYPSWNSKYTSTSIIFGYSLF